MSKGESQFRLRMNYRTLIIDTTILSCLIAPVITKLFDVEQ